MKITFSKWVLFLVFGVFFYTACNKKDKEPQPNSNVMAEIKLEFDNVAGNQNLQLNSTTYTNAVGEQFTVSLFNYYVSNFVFKTAQGNEYVVPQDSCYFLVQESNRNSQVVKMRVPEGDYTEVSFVIGVDSLRNTMDVSRRTGSLDVANLTGENKMYWSWNSGYIFVKLEGNSPAAPADPTGARRFRYHIGGFGGYSSRTINNIKTTTISFGNQHAKVRKGKSPLVHLEVDVLKVFNGSTNLSIASHPTVMFSPFSVNIANNYQKMFSFHHLHNE
ncbi:MAG: hypothetical protein NZ551_11385 [Microscillaceae bacterium]|nr:hypothetical protein [Microscillaceae bacterium]MDW8461797.1 hypothetical protein [Cytophagales bacterium]